MLGRNAEALPHYQASFRLRPDNVAISNNLGLTLARLGRMQEAATQFATSLRIDPNNQEARDYLVHAQAELQGGAQKK